jgi:hypothetical protein
MVLGDELVVLADFGVDAVAEGAAAQPVQRAVPDTFGNAAYRSDRRHSGAPR